MLRVCFGVIDSTHHVVQSHEFDSWCFIEPGVQPGAQGVRKCHIFLEPEMII